MSFVSVFSPSVTYLLILLSIIYFKHQVMYIFAKLSLTFDLGELDKNIINFILEKILS